MDVAAALPDGEIVARDDDSQPIVVEVEQEPIAPQMDDDAVQAVIDDLNAVTSVPMTVVVNVGMADIDPASVRSWLRPTSTR